MNNSALIPKVAAYCHSLEQGFSLIPAKRKEILLSLSDYISRKFKKNKDPNLIVICTHNSRRSHIGQLWLAAGADYYKLPSIATYSGGTEATAFNIRAVRVFQRIGFDIKTKDKNINNPICNIKWEEEMQPYVAFSKKYSSSPNPTEAFAAIMVCTDADAACPLISGCDFRLALPYDDPKGFDDTLQEEAQYDERCRQIGREMLFVLRQIQQ